MGPLWGKLEETPGVGISVIFNRIRDRVDRGLDAVVSHILDESNPLVPIDTTALQHSCDATPPERIGDLSVAYVGYGIEGEVYELPSRVTKKPTKREPFKYAPFVHNGTSRMTGVPFLLEVARDLASLRVVLIVGMR